MADVTIAANGTYPLSNPLSSGTNVDFLNTNNTHDGVLVIANGGLGVSTSSVNGTLSTSAYLNYGGGGSVTNFLPANYVGQGGDFVTIQQIKSLFSALDVSATATTENTAFDNAITFAAQNSYEILIIDGTIEIPQGETLALDAVAQTIINDMAVGVFGTAADSATLVLQLSDARSDPHSNFPFIDGVFWTETAINPCFASGTRILTPRGEVSVEALRPGDAVITRAGEEVPIIWIGRREVTLAGLKRPEVVRPIVIEPGALDDGVPSRRLVLSPDHALYLDGVLVQAKSLINWTSIRPDESATSVRYFHIELPAHDVLFAEGAAAESFLDTGHRGVFDNAEERVIALPSAMQARRETESCARLVTEGPELDAIRARIAQRQVGIRLAGL